MKRLGRFLCCQLNSRVIPSRIGEDFILRLANVEDAKDCNYLLSHMFTSNEPISTCLELKNETYKFLDLCLEEDFAEQLSCVATLDDEIVGCIYAHEFDLSGYIPEEMIDFVERNYEWGIVFDLLGELEDDFIEHCEKDGHRKPIHSVMGGVYPEYHGNRLLQNMMEMIIDNARERGFDVLFGEATSYFSQKKNEYFKASVVSTTKYKEYEYDGVKYFENAKDVMIEKIKKEGKYREELKDEYCEECVLYEIHI